MAKKKSIAATPIESTKHRDSRKNIPTEELRDFVEEQEQKPVTVLYPRDPSLDPQLVWKGKDEQDSKDLEVPAVPIYIQEKIHPQAIIEQWRVDSAKWRAGNSPLATRHSSLSQPTLFQDFNGLTDFDKKVDFYRHDQHWSNRMILGDSLLVMTSLAEKEGLKGKVQTIYFDPPYGIKFGSNWQVSTRKRDVKDGKAEDATRQPEQVKAFRDTYQLGIHSYLPYLRDRLMVAHSLLTESGSIFLQIGDENVHLARLLLDEVFGPTCFRAQINYRSMTALGQDGMASVYDYVLWYGKNSEGTKFRSIYADRPITDEPEFCFIADENGAYRKLSPAEVGRLDDSDKARVFKRSELRSSGFTPSCTYAFRLGDGEYRPSAGKSWRTHAEGMNRLIAAHRLILLGVNPYYRQYYSDFPVMQIENSWHDTAAGFSDTKIYVVQTSDRIIQRCLLMTTDPGDLVLDPTCGSGTTAYVAEQWGRRWITTDTSRVAIALARTRLMTGRFPYYLLSDSPEGVKKEADLTGKTPPPHKTDGDIRKGFVYQRVPHVTLKSIANNPDIKEGMTRKQIDEAIARHAETETLYDKPYDDKSRLRVTGPFTVESLSPHRTISVEAKKAAATKPTELGFTIKMLAGGSFTNMILENLKKAGVQNTVKNERLKFDSIEPFAGEWICGEGRYRVVDSGEVASGELGSGSPLATSHSSLSRRAAICIGPEHGTVGPQLVKEAAKEAVRGVGFDILIICGFAFDPHVSEEAKRYGKLTILSARMNPDLAMGDELLKKTGAGNLFMVFGEPDVEVVSEEWLVDSSGKRIAPYELYKIVSGTDRLAEINGLGAGDLRRYAVLSQRREVWADLADAAGGGVDPRKHRGGSGEKHDRRVSAIARHVEGFAGGIGNVDDFVRELGFADQRKFRSFVEQLRGSKQVAQWADQIACHSPLTTRHFCRVTLRGLDVYDPTTGEIRSNSTDDIACWFIDTDYNGESFFVRHAYFTGADEPYEKLKNALRSEIDEAAWTALYSTRSRPFDKPETGKIAVKVINHYGDEVMKVFPA